MIDEFFNVNTELSSVFVQLGIPISSFNWKPLHSPPGTIYAADAADRARKNIPTYI